MPIKSTSIAALLILSAVAVCSGCGTVEESTTETTTWTEPTPASTPSPLEYRIDSLMTENRRLRMQVDAMAAETRNLTARNAELETRLNEALATPKAPPPPADMTSGYSTALGEYRRKNFSGAVSRFDALLNAGISENLADNCHYWLGESYYGMGKYREALEQFQKVFSYAHSEKKGDAQMMIGNCYLAQRDNAAARNAFEKLISNYPVSPHIAKAKEKLARIK